MKTNLFFATIATVVVMTGCSKNDVYNSTIAGEQDKIEFTPVVGKQTRGTEIISADLQKNGTALKLYGYKTGGEFASRGNNTFSTFFDNTPEALTFNGYWSTGKDYAWTDLAAGYLSIFTFYSPKNVLTGITAPTTSAPAKFEYTIPTAIADQEDLLVAAQLNMTKSNTGGLIAINFKHALSQLYFKAKLISTGYKAAIRSIKVMGAANTNIFTYNVSGTDAGAWGAIASGSINYIFADGIAQSITSKDIADRVASQNGSLMLMPQKANTGTFKFEVTYDVFDSSGAVIGARIVKTADMAALEMGKKYAYTLILPAAENDNIAFDVTVSNWDDTNVNTTREVRFDDYKLNGASDEADIADLITGYTPSVVYLQEVKITTTDALTTNLTINLSGLNSAAVSGSKIILDCTIPNWDSKSITVTAPTGWTVTDSPLSANGKITVTKN